MTLEYWVRGNGTVSTTGTEPTHLGWTYGIDAKPHASDFRFYVHDGTTTNYVRHVYEAGEDIRDDNIWRQIVLIANGTRLKIYINGVLKAMMLVVGQEQLIGTPMLSIGVEEIIIVIIFSKEIWEYLKCMKRTKCR